MPKKAQFRKPDRPKPRPLFYSKTPSWVAFDPARLAPVGGSVCGLLALGYYVFRHWSGASVPGLSVVVGVAFTFVVGYAATGIFVYWLLFVATREFPEMPPESKAKSEAGTAPLASGRKSSEAGEESSNAMPAP